MKKTCDNCYWNWVKNKDLRGTSQCLYCCRSYSIKTDYVDHWKQDSDNLWSNSTDTTVTTIEVK